MFGIIFLIIITYVVYLDAKMLRAEDEEIYRDSIRGKPLLWTVLSFLLFIIVAPLYWLRRQKYLNLLAKKRPEIGPTAYRNPHFRLIAEATGVAILSFFFVFLYSVPFYIIRKSDQIETIIFLVQSLISNLIFILIIYDTFKKQRREGFWKSLYFIKAKNFFLNSIFLPVLVALGTAAFTHWIKTARIIAPETPFKKVISSGDSTTLFVLIVFFLIAPFAEELIIRGYFFSVIEKVKGGAYSLCVITILFASIHVEQNWGDWIILAIISFLGLVLTLFRLLTGSIVPGIVAHFAHNSLVLTIPLFMLMYSSPPYLKYTLTEGNDTETREILLQRSIEEYPEFLPAYNDLAWLYGEREENLDQALFLIDKALSNEPANQAFLDTKAEILYKLKRYDEAIEIEKALVKKCPDQKFFKDQLDKFTKAKQSHEGERAEPTSLPSPSN